MDSADLLAVLRDTWPQQKGLASLLFQDDLFRRLRRLEALAEGKTVDDEAGESLIDGFLPDEFPLFDADEDYKAAWGRVEASVESEGWEHVDRLEDVVCEWCEDMIPEKIAFFSAALESGSLDDSWLAKAEILLEAEQVPMAPAPVPVPEPLKVEESAEQIIALEPERRPSVPTRRRLAGLPITPTRVRRLVRKTRRR
jgi:hypothetical protein